MPRDRAAENAAARARRKADPERYRAADRAKRAKNPLRYKSVSFARNSAKRLAARAVRFDLSAVWQAHDGRCNICGECCDSEWWHADHVVPLSRGGEHALDNIAPAHPYCNVHKGGRLNAEVDAAWLRETRAAWEAGDAGQRMRTGQRSPCGTHHRYWRGCRCDDCRTAYTAFRRATYVPRPRKPPPIGVGPRTLADLAFHRLRLQGWLVAPAAREAGISATRARRLER